MNLPVPYCKIRTFQLNKIPTDYLYISLDDKTTWTNGIFENSRYLILSLGNSGIECVGKSFKLPTFRKSKKITSRQLAEAYIQKYLEKV